MSKGFVHLHVHSEYSLLDGLSKISPLIKHIKDNDMDSLAITDHGVLYGAIEFYKKARKKGVKPIIGMEAYITHHDLGKKPERGKAKNYHLILLAKNETGYKNLIKLTSIAHLEGYYYRPRVTRQILARYSKGLICTSACHQGELAQSIVNDEPKNSENTVQWYLDTFKDNYYLEIQRHPYSEFISSANDESIRQELTQMVDNQDKVNKQILKLSRKYGVPIVATNDSHYIKASDATAQDALLCIATGKTISDTKRLRFIDVPDFYIKSPAAMYELYSDLPEAVENTVTVAKKCNVKISTYTKWYFPKYPLPKKKTAEKYLEELVYKNLKKRIKKVTDEIKKRVDYELGIINKKGYAPYFLIFMDIVSWANERGIITNTRGSAAGSLVSYSLGITTVDPLKYYLPFERFLNPFRPSPPDIDLDVADDRREELLEYMSKKYGKDKVAQICTFGRMLSRAAVRDVARVLGYPYATGDRIAKLIPRPKQGFPITIPKALKEVGELKELKESDDDVKRILDLATQVEGNVRHVSVHAAGVVISPSKLTDFTPLQKEPSGDKIITQYEMHAAEDVGLIKFDILGIRNLSILGASVTYVKETKGIDVDLRKISLNDKKTFEMLGRGETMGVFQFSSSGMTKYLVDLKPTKIEDLMAMVALYRPGPIAVIPEYIRRKHNPKLVKYLDPRMKKYLRASYGLIVYQDDLLFSALDLAGYTWEEADKFRNAVGKKIPSEMAAQKEKFIKGIVKNGQTKGFAETLWDLFEPFQAYGFNKAHAASYGMIAYQTAYMKANFPEEFMCALLTAESSDTDKIALAVNECRRMRLDVLPPDINKSGIGFRITKEEGKEAIRFGLSAIKNVGNAAVEAILAAREEGDFVSFPDFLSRVDNRRVNKRVLESLIKVGALSSFGKRAAILSSMEELRRKVSKPKKNENQQDLFGTDEIKKSMKSSDTILKASIDEFSDDELQALERQLLGFSLSARPISELISEFDNRTTHKIKEITTDEVNQSLVKVAVVVTEVRVVITKTSGQEMAFVKVTDDTGTIDLVVFPKIFKSTRSVWVDNHSVLITGKVDTRDDKPSIIVNQIHTVEDLDDDGNRLFIKIPKDVSANQLKSLKKLLLDSPGSQKVTLIFEGKKESQVELEVGVKWNEDLAMQISEALGQDLQN